MKVALVVIYNHYFPENIEKINEIYKNRFDFIRHLVPFYQGNSKGVIATYENSNYFSGYVAQAARDLLELEVDHFLFIADDLILNPTISSQNFREVFHLKSLHSNFFPGFLEFSKLDKYWPRAKEALRWRTTQTGLEISSLLPSVHEASAKFDKLGLRASRVSKNSLTMTLRENLENLLCDFLPIKASSFRKLGHPVIWSLQKIQELFMSKKLHYPLVGGYSDIFAVSYKTLPSFAHYCGIFSSSRLFVEVAIPTAMVFASEEISTEDSTSLRGRAYWGSEVDELARFGESLDDLLTNFPTGQMYVHPVKLSRWKRGSS